MKHNKQDIPRPNEQANSDGASSSNYNGQQHQVPQSIVDRENKRLQRQLEEDYWRACDEQEAYNSYLKVYPNGFHAQSAKDRITSSKKRSKLRQGKGNQVMFIIFMIAIAIIMIMALAIRVHYAKSSNSAPAQSHLVAPVRDEVTAPKTEEALITMAPDNEEDDDFTESEALWDEDDEEDDEDDFMDDMFEENEKEDDIFNYDEDDEDNLDKLDH